LLMRKLNTVSLLAILAFMAHLGACAQGLPATVEAALAQARVPPNAVAMLVIDANGKAPARLSHRGKSPMNPASVMKLVTSYAALDLLGPSFVWHTPVWVDGPVVGGVLQGNVVIQGQGDPKLVLEKLWLLLRRLQSLDIHTIAGDIILDNRAFDVPASDPAEFDSEPLRPYNAASEALLINFKSVVMTFTPDTQANIAHIQFDPPLAGVQLPTSVPLIAIKGVAASACADYRAALKADFLTPTRIRFSGSYPASCGEKVWPMAYADPTSYNARAIEGLWRSMGGKLIGVVRSGAAPAAAATFEVISPTLAEVIRDVNKFSNNVMAQQIFLTLGLDRQNGGVASTPERARAAVQQWWTQRMGSADAPTIDNGSGLSRQTRISAQALCQMLLMAYASSRMPELMASLPIVGIDGTLKRSRAQAGSAHLKTGSLRDVSAIAGYVHAASGARYVLVAMVNHPNAAAARPALDALVEWAASDGP
jgi:D-alanyl-D-alanine carboxypeptidase/D-alanyl-D-alanine-endopeptidase (penicillin-binding protein 4)